MNGSFRMLALMMAGLFLLASGCQASFSEERDPTSNVTSPPITTTSGADTVLTTESSAETTVSSGEGTTSAWEGTWPFESILSTSGNVRFGVEVTATIQDAIFNTWGAGISYPSVIELQHSGSQNGTLLATFEVRDSGKTGTPTSFRILKSTDGGETWHVISRVTEQIDTTIEACWNPHLFELSEPLGDMPTGTLLLSACSIDPGQKRKSHLSLWFSLDGGVTWLQRSVIAEGGGLKEGVWEPYLLYEEGYLYCFYSDDSHPNHDQAIVYRRTRNGLTWEAPVEVVAAENRTYRPGMGIVTKMGNGTYFIVYEIGGDWNGVPLHYKITDDLTDWDASDLGRTIKSVNGYTMGSGPWCVWSPIGGECGTLIVTGKYGSDTPNKLFVSFDYGETFETIDNPLPHSNASDLGYSASLFLSSDGTTLFYGNTVDGPNGKARVDFARIKIFVEE